jgi:hypothetical protein
VLVAIELGIGLFVLLAVMTVAAGFVWSVEKLMSYLHIC